MAGPLVASRSAAQSDAKEERRSTAVSPYSSAATVRIVHFVSPGLQSPVALHGSNHFSGDCTSPASSVSSSSCSLSQSESLLLSVGDFNILVDCPLDFQSLLLLPPQYFPRQGVGLAGEQDSRPETQGCDSDLKAPKGCSSSSSLPASSRLSVASAFFSSACSPRGHRPLGVPGPLSGVAPCSSSLPLVDASLHAPCALSPFLRALLPLRLDAILLTHPHGALGLPLLAEFLDLSETPVLGTPPVLLAASSSIRFLQSSLGGELLPAQAPADRGPGPAATPRGPETGGRGRNRQRQGSEADATTTRPHARSAVEADEENWGSLPPVVQDEEACVEADGNEEDEERPDTGSSLPAFASKQRGEGTNSQFLAGVSRHIWPTMFNQERLLHAASLHQMCVSPVSSGFCLGGANWVLSTPANQKIVVVGPSSCELEANRGAKSGSVSPQDRTLPDEEASCAPSNRNDDQDALRVSTLASSSSSSFSSVSSRYPLAADWRPLSGAALVVFFCCVPRAAGGHAEPSARCESEKKSFSARGEHPPDSRAPGASAPVSRGCPGDTLQPAPRAASLFEEAFPTPQKTSLQESSLFSRPLLPPAPPSPLRSLSSSLDELKRLISDTVHVRRGNVLVPLDLCGLSFLEILETVASASSHVSSLAASRSSLVPAVPVYCVGPGLPALLQFAVEGAEWVAERRAARTRDMHSPRPPFFLSACEDEELLLSGQLFLQQSAVGSRTRNLSVGEKLVDVMPLREPSILLLSHASLRIGEACLLLEKWKHEERHLLISVDRRFAASTPVRLPAGEEHRANPPCASSQGSASSAGSYEALGALLWPFLAPPEAAGKCASGQGGGRRSDEEGKRENAPRKETREGPESTSDTASSLNPSDSSSSGLRSMPRRPESTCIPFAPSRGFRMRVASLPLDPRLDETKIAKLLSHFQPRSALLPAAVYASVNSQMCALHALGHLRPQGRRSVPGGPPSVPDASSLPPSAAFTTELASFEAHRSKEIVLERVFSPGDAAAVARAFSLVLLDAEGAEADAREGETNDPEPAEAGSGGAFPRCFLTPVPAGRAGAGLGFHFKDTESDARGDFPSQTGNLAGDEDGLAAQDTCDTRLSVGWIAPGGLLRGSGEAAADRGLLTLILPPSPGAGNAADSGAAARDGEKASSGQGVHATPAKEPPVFGSLFFGTFAPEQLLFVLRDRGFHDAALHFREPHDGDHLFGEAGAGGLAQERREDASADAENRKAEFPSEAELPARDGSRLPVLTIPSLKSRIVCQEANLTEIEAPDAATRRFLRGLIGQILVELQAPHV
ncbi:conserved hypothetical protein [Neospora caninum Liverpool]|uniref:Uncharacterized protein n=1 Tax=Neospora caninum (strain Liverpool) TaxID=572307 RepID=F0VK10_NEOCL|nr:conserved hypothetical protein [Neospora caninum Liverpool]CBZ54055.1 conserved hypothetical protein [Neospora caninum Liverpool]CEL68751.1 TPA: hypothetical protein BN1204_044890 [Neospora caninum Liverpool]|eukprot:XP_003884086.1 conserved hypothetical protein [Neospora caninum Liverpool]